MARFVRIMAWTIAASALAACGAEHVTSSGDPGGAASSTPPTPAEALDTPPLNPLQEGVGATAGSTGGPSDVPPARATDPRIAAAIAACATRPTIAACLADQEHACRWGPNWGWPVLEDGDPCEPADGICYAALAPPRAPQCTADPLNDVACRADGTQDACLADTEHRCWWTPSSFIGAPCSPDGAWCPPQPPPPHCETTADCPPRCASTLPEVGVLAGPHSGRTLYDPTH